MSKKRIFLASFTVVSILLILSVSIAFADGVGSVNGGGQIHEAPEGAKRPYWHVISFGGWVEGFTDPVGEWQVNFHNVGVDSLNNSHFHTTDIRAVSEFTGNGTSCDAALNMTAFGSLNNVPGYKMIFRAGDFGSPGFVDTVRVELWNPVGAKIYDTYWSNEFAAESNCVGTARTGLDAGNITIVLP